MEGALELRGEATGLLDDPLVLRVRGGGDDGVVAWRARHRDDDGRVWRAGAARPEELAAGWAARGAEPGTIAALRSLRPVSIDVRAETAGGRAAARTVTRRLAGDGVRLRRWRDGLPAALHLPAPGEPPCAAAILDATGTGAAAAALAAPLLASRGALVLALYDGDPDAAAGRLAAVPAAAGLEVAVLPAPAPPPGIAVQGEGEPAFAARAAAWDGLLARLGARARATA